MKITPTSLLTTGTRMLITYLLGAFMFINLAVIATYSVDAYDNLQQYKALDVPFEARLFKFHGTEFVSDPAGVNTHCYALMIGEFVHISNARNKFCRQVFTVENLTNWKKMAPVNKSSRFVEATFWGIMFFLVFLGGFFLIATIPANIMGSLFTGFARYTNIAALVFSLAIILPFWTLFTIAAVTPAQSYWMTPDGYTVSTSKVFVGPDAQLYKAPDSLFGWTSTQTMEKVSK